jgi:flagellar assembly factor FliW
MTLMLEEPTVPTIAITTLFKGEVQVPEEELVSFINPLLGFEHLKRFLIYQTDPGPLYWMQSAEEAKVSFCLLAPFQAGLDPDLEISGEDVADIGARDAEDITVYTVVVLDKDPKQVRTNLRAPILVSRGSRQAKQVVLQDSRLPIRFYLRDLGLKAAGS